MFVAGVVLGIVLPKAVEGSQGSEIGRWQMYARAAGFQTAQAVLSSSDAPVVTTVELRSDAPLRAAVERQVVTLTVFDESDQTVFRAELGFPQAAALESPQTNVHLFREVIAGLEASNGRYRFVIDPGRDFADSVLGIDLSLNAGAIRLDPRMQPAGFVLMALGFVGLALTFRKSRDNSMPPPSKWGRG